MVGTRTGHRRGGTRFAPPQRTRTRWQGRLLAPLAAALVLALALAATASAQPQSTSVQPRWLLFTADPSGLAAEQIYRIQLSGGGVRQLTRGTASSVAPAFSPDGKRIAFARLGVGIFSMDIDGKDVRQLTRNGRDSFPAWSPDGRQIAFLRPFEKNWRVHVMSASGADQRRLPQAPSAGRPSWTQRGLLIANEGDLAQLEPASGRVQKLLGAIIDLVGGLDSTSVSPDLTALTYVGSREPNPGDMDCGEGYACPRFALYLEDLRTPSEPRLLVRDAGPAAFSPDGKRIAYVLANQLVIRQLASGATTTLKLGKLVPTVSSPPAWQPR